MDVRKISIDPSGVAWRLGLVAALLVATNFSMQAYRLVGQREHVTGLAMMSLDGENNLPALFSTALLCSAALLLLLVAMLGRRERSPDTSKWLILAAGFALMALDEALALHEHLIEPMRGLLGGERLGIFFFAWVIPAIVLVGALAVFFLPFLFRLPRPTAIAFVAAGAIYLGGALGVELVEGWWREGHGHRNLMYHALVSAEEGMEMVGVIVFIRALLAHLAGRFGEVRFDFRGAGAVAATPGTARPDQPPMGESPLLRPVGK